MTRQLSDFEIERAARHVSALLGLHFPETRRRELRLGLSRAVEELGLQPDATLEWLSKGELSQRELDVLAAHLTVGETYFFREKGVFRALENEVLPALVRERRDATRKLQIWSAGCCTGEEPYSVAMLLERMIPDIDGWDVSILGTDVNPRFLRRAVAGVYKQWSFRDVDARIQRLYFTSPEPGHYELSPSLKQRVRFAHLNLVEDTFPSPLNATWGVDLILCRNVLMYFAPETMLEVVARFRRCLVPGGWLIVSPTETSQRLFPGFEQVNCEDAILYRRLDETAKQGRAAVERPLEPAPQASPPQSPLNSASVMRRPSPRRSASRAASAPPRTGGDVASRTSPGEHLTQSARRAADRGELERALGLCEQALELEKMDPEVHHLHATILLELGRSSDAARALSRALYLDPDFVLAHFALGSLAQQQHEFGKAKKHFGNVLLLLNDTPSDAELPRADGLTAGRLAELTRGLLSKLA